MPVDQHQDAPAVVARAAEPAHPDESVAAVAGDVETRRALQNVAQGAIAELPDFLPGNDRDRGGGLRDFLLMLGGGHHGRDLHLHEIFQRQAGQILCRKIVCVRARGQGRERGREKQYA